MNKLVNNYTCCTNPEDTSLILPMNQSREDSFPPFLEWIKGGILFTNRNIISRKEFF